MGRRKKERSILAGLDVTEKKIRKSHKLSNLIFGGSEPEWEIPNHLSTESEAQMEFKNQLGKHFNWYNIFINETKKKKYLVEYTEKYFPKLVDQIKKLPESLFKSGLYHTSAILSRCIFRGAPIVNDKFNHKERLDTFIQKVSDRILNPVNVEEHTEYNSENPYDYWLTSALNKLVEEKKETKRARDSKVSECIGIVDSLIDDFLVKKKKFADNCMSDTVLKAGTSKIQLNQVSNRFTNIINDLDQIDSDEEIKEAYKNYTPGTLKKLYNWLVGAPSEELIFAVKKARKPRKKKQKKPEQILKLFVYQKSDPELKLNSIDPEYILGAQQLWVYNTKTRKLGVYRAEDGKSLDVSRKSIVNYNEKTSICKKVRKPKETVVKVCGEGKVGLKHFMDNIRAVGTPMRSRIGDTVLLLRALK
jgi:hypothetical protein